MSETNHTPGPWHVVVGDNYSVKSEHTPNKYPHRFPGDDLGPIIALIGNRSADFGQSDARLIAAAPELLAALVDLVESVQIADPGVYDIDGAIAAIRKATGKEASE